MQEQSLVPDTIIVAQQPLLAVQLPDGAIGAVFSYLCAALALATNKQVRRIWQDALLSKALIATSIETAGGPQRMNVLLVWGIPLWLMDVRVSAVAPALRALEQGRRPHSIRRRRRRARRQRQAAAR